MDELEPQVLSESEQAALQAPSAACAHFDVLGRCIRIAGNDPALLDRFRRLYEPLYRATAAGPAFLEIRYHYDGAVFLVARGEQGYRFSHPAMAEQPAMIFTRLIMESCTDYILLHAAALSCAGRGVVLAGSTGLGKSTLAAHLAVRGHGFFSDEIAALQPDTGCLHPFPLRLGLRPGPGQVLVEQVPAVAQDVLDDPKLLVDCLTLSGCPPAEPCPVKAVILLTTRAVSGVQTVIKRTGLVKAWFTVDASALREAVSSLPGISGCRWAEDGQLTAVVMQVEDLPRAIPALQVAARGAGSLLAMVQHEDFDSIDHQHAPAWVRLSASAGVLELLKRMPGAYRNQLLRDRYEGRASALVLALSKTLAGVSFYKLTPGRLEEMLALVEEMAAGRLAGTGGP